MRLRSPIFSLCALLAALTLVACGGDDEAARTTTTVAERGWFAYSLDLRPPAQLSGDALATWQRGQRAYNENGCGSCHALGDNPNEGHDLTDVGSRLSAEDIREVLVEPKAPMPSFGQLASRDPRKFAALVDFLASLE